MNKDNHRSFWLQTFERCVVILERIAQRLDPIWPGGMDYVKINVILFCILLPILILTLLGIIVFLL